jgi:uncharacterized ion transporter superfamily protein YfcC
VPHVFVLLSGVILVCSVLTWIVPSGAYQREERSIEGRVRTLLVPGTYTPIPKDLSLRALVLGEPVPGRATPVGLHGFLTAIPRGLEQAADIVFFILIVGGVFGILQRTGVITASIGAILHLLGGNAVLLTIALMAAIAVGGSTLGMGEEFIPLVPVFLALARRLGYDRVFGLGLVLLAADTGFAASTTNPFTVSVAQGIAEVPLHSGMGLRIVFLACAVTLAIVHLLRYGVRVKRDPAASLVADLPDADLADAGRAGASREAAALPADAAGPLSAHHGVIVAVCAAIFGLIVFAVQRLDWWMADMGGGFLLMGIVAAAAARLSVDDAVKAFVRGLEEMIVAALVVGFARGIAVVLAEGQIIDTIIHAAASVLIEVPRHLAVLGMLVFESTLNFFVPSGSGQAAVSMPLMAPLADVLGLTRQTAVFAFTCGDGFSNLIIPTSGILMAMLGLARVPYERWLRFVGPLFVQLIALSAAFLIAAAHFGYR